jgi:hypothetical protein
MNINPLSRFVPNLGHQFQIKSLLNQFAKITTLSKENHCLIVYLHFECVIGFI